jgi:hypothetical protein
MNDTTQTIVAFLRSIGISVQEAAVADDSFLPGVCIRDGCLIFDRSTLRWPGDLLHEAGHIATMPAPMRSTLSDALDATPEVAHAGEVEATAWAYAAVVHLRLKPSVLFHAEGYDGRSDQLIATYGLGVYPGCFGLAQAGMTRIGADALQEGVPPYPHMIQWLRGE